MNYSVDIEVEIEGEPITLTIDFLATYTGHSEVRTGEAEMPTFAFSDFAFYWNGILTPFDFLDPEDPVNRLLHIFHIWGDIMTAIENAVDPNDFTYEE